MSKLLKRCLLLKKRICPHPRSPHSPHAHIGNKLRPFRVEPLFTKGGGGQIKKHGVTQIVILLQNGGEKLPCVYYIHV